MTGRRATLADVAAHAGVSAVTVSRVLRHPEMVSEALGSRVESAVGQLGYIRNQLASALASTRSGIVGVVVPSLTNGVFVDYLTAIHELMIPAGFQVMVFNARYSSRRGGAGYRYPARPPRRGDDRRRRRPDRALAPAAAQSGIPVVQTMDMADEPVDINIGLSPFGCWLRRGAATSSTSGTAASAT